MGVFKSIYTDTEMAILLIEKDAEIERLQEINERLQQQCDQWIKAVLLRAIQETPDDE